MSPTTLLLICVTAMGVMNLLPWGGPTMRSASVLGIEANVLWMQLVGIVIALFTAFFWGTVEKKRGAGINSMLEIEDTMATEEENSTERSDLIRPNLFWFNICLTLIIIVCLIFLPVPSCFTFMIGCVAALSVNYPGAKLQNKTILRILPLPWWLCRNGATFISPVVPATFLGVGLAGVEIKDYIKNSFFWIWGVSLVCMAAGLVLGVITL